MRDEPNFVASIAGAPASPSSSSPPPPVEPPTMEQPVTVPEAWSVAPQRPQPRPKQRRKQHQRMMSRVLLLAIVVGFAVYAAGTGGPLIGMLREGASARVVPAEGGSLLRAV